MALMEAAVVDAESVRVRLTAMEAELQQLAATIQLKNETVQLDGAALFLYVVVYSRCRMRR